MNPIPVPITKCKQCWKIQDSSPLAKNSVVLCMHEQGELVTRYWIPTTGEYVSDRAKG